MEALALLSIVTTAAAVAVAAASARLARGARGMAVAAVADVERYKAENPPVVMPTIDIDAQGRVTNISWDLGYVESGATRVFAIPIIPALGVGVLHITGTNGLSVYLEIDFANGRTHEISEAEFALRQRPGGGLWSNN